MLVSGFAYFKRNESVVKCLSGELLFCVTVKVLSIVGQGYCLFIYIPMKYGQVRVIDLLVYRKVKV